MKCKDAEKMIPAFLADELDYDETKLFLSHIESCPECYEELTIQTLVTEGMNQLESGNSFNLQGTVDYKISNGKNHLFKYKRLVYILGILEIIVIALLLFCIHSYITL